MPPPLQKPHPPIYIAASRTQATLEYLVSTGHPLIIGVVLDTKDALDLCHRFVTLSREAGHDVPMSRIPFSSYFYVAETEREAREDTEAGLRWNLDMIQWRRTFTEGSEVHHRLDDWRRTRAGPPQDTDYIYENRAIIGTPDRCAARIAELRSEGIEYFVCNFAFGGLDHQKLMRSMKLFAKEVMPRFA